MDAQRRLSDRGRQILSVVSVVLAAGLAVGLAAHAVHGDQVDIDVYLMGGAHASSPHLYSLRLAGTNLFFTYPPFAAIVFIPLAHTPRDVARILWALANVGGMIWLLYVSIRALRPELPKARCRSWAALLVFPALALDPALVDLYLGQLNVFIVALVMADLALDSKRLPRGVLTGLAAAMKLTPLIFIPYLVLTRQIRAACWAAATFLVCGAAGFALAPHASWLFWTKNVFIPSRAGNLLFISNQNLKSAALRLAHGTVPPALLWSVTILVGLSGLGLAAWAYRESSSVLGILVTAVTGLIVSPITWSHHLVWAVPAILWLALGADAPAAGRKWAVAATLFFWAGPIWWVPSHDRGLRENVWELFIGDSYFWAMLVFLVGIAVLLARRWRLERPKVPAAAAQALQT